MNRKNLERLAKDPRFVPGIYNYCDRWCERCPNTSRCLNYAMCETTFNSDESQEAFWDKLGTIFATTLQMLHEKAEEMGIDLDAIDHKEIEKQEK